MRNPLSTIGWFCAAFWLYFAMLKGYESRPDWNIVTVSLGFCFLFILFSLVFAYLRTLELKFEQLTKILSDTFVKLAAIEQQNFTRYNSYGQQPSNIHVTFQGNGVKWEADAMDFMSVEDLEKERKKAEKAEDYEKAAIIQKKIDQKKKRS